MAEGKRWHKEFEDWVNKYHRWPIQFDPNETMPGFINPKTEVKVTHQILDWCELVGIIDLYCENDGGLILDWKTGKTEASTHLSSPQTGIYALLATANDVPVKKVGIAHFDANKKKTDTAYRWVTKSLIEEAFDTVETVASEIHSYFEANGFYQQYGDHRKQHYAQREQL